MALQLSGDALGLGKVLQVVQGKTETQVTTSSSTYIDTGLSATITPSSASSKILVLITQNGIVKTGNTDVLLRAFRDATQIARGSGGYTNESTPNGVGSISFMLLDSPATTSPVTYKTQFAGLGSPFSGTAYVQSGSGTSTIILIEVAA